MAKVNKVFEDITLTRVTKTWAYIRHDIGVGPEHTQQCRLHYDNMGIYFLYKHPFSTALLPTRYNLKDFK